MTDKTPAKQSQTTSPQRYDPFSAFRQEMDRLFDSFLGGGGGPPRGFLGAGGGEIVVPQIEVKETPEAYRVTAELPGMAEDDVEVTLSDGLLTLRGEKKSESTSEKDNFHLTERRYGSFQRSVRLPETIDEEKIAAHFDKGVLSVEVPKRPEAQKSPKKIAIGKKS